MDYSAIDAVNYSTLKRLRPPDGSPMHYRYALDHPQEETPAMLLGRLIHTAAFEPDMLLHQYVSWDGDRRGSKYAAFAADAHEAGRAVVKAAEWEQARAIRDSIMAVPEIAEMLDSPCGEAEAVLEWTNRETGIRCKGRADWVLPGVILDLKTTGYGIEPRAFSAHCWRMGYWFQAAMYQEGYAEMRGEVPRFGIIAAETSAPYAVRLYWLAPTGLMAAWDEYVACLRTVKECRESGVWPGPERVSKLEPPAWAVANMEDAVDFSGIGEG